MIQTLTITNFQSHAHSELKFVPGVNVIVGPTDCGKTSIIRALRWLIWNRPLGEAFRSRWGGDTLVRILDTNGYEITRTKGKTNSYRINDDRFDAIRNEVPEEVQKILNIDETNLQQQFDSHFLLSSSPGEVAVYFNQIANLNQIDASIKFVNSQLYSLSSELKLNKGKKKEFLQKLQQFEYLEKFETELEVLEGMEKQNIQRINSANQLGAHIVEIGNIEAFIEEGEAILQYEHSVDSILKMYEHLRELENLLYSLEQVLTALNKNTVKRIQLDSKIKKLEEKFHKEMPEYCPLCGGKYKKVEPDD